MNDLKPHTAENIDVCLIHSRATSKTQPYELTLIPDTRASGKLYISSAPGRRDSKHRRDLKTDLEVLKAANVRVIVCVLEWSELEYLKIQTYPRMAQEHGFKFLHLPIPDRNAPCILEAQTFVSQIIAELEAHNNVLIHCRAGLGRAGTIAACCLKQLGYCHRSSIRKIRKHRPGAIQTSAQMHCIKHYCRQ